MARFTQTPKVELLDRFLIMAPTQLNYVCRHWRWHDNHDQPHEGSGSLPPAMGKLPEANETVWLNDVVYSSRLGGLRKHYKRRAV